MWEITNNHLSKEFNFKSFEEAIKFISVLAVICANENHHPEIVNLYSKVTLSFCTHDAGNKVTELDYKLSRLVDEIVL
tara:strand:+ start:1369 stop:1602 length:234 start_codon:yes stop_codon:yes gene_type:complete